MSEALLELIKETISKIESYETRARDRNPKAQVNFEHAVKVILFDLTNGRCEDTACLAEYVESLPKQSGGHSYYVSGYGDTGYASGEVSKYGDRYVEGYIFLEDGSEVYFDGEFIGRGLVAGSDENGNYYEFNID